MTRKEQIHKQSIRYTKETHSPSSVSEFQAAMNISVIKAFIAGAEWADETMLQKVLGWLKENFYNIHVLHDDRLKGNFESKEQMLQSFKERFNVVDNCDQQYPSDFINDR